MTLQDLLIEFNKRRMDVLENPSGNIVSRRLDNLEWVIASLLFELADRDSITPDMKAEQK